jgi:hypothetical protein
MNDKPLNVRIHESLGHMCIDMGGVWEFEAGNEIRMVPRYPSYIALAHLVCQYAADNALAHSVSAFEGAMAALGLPLYVKTEAAQWISSEKNSKLSYADCPNGCPLHTSKVGCHCCNPEAWRDD